MNWTSNDEVNKTNGPFMEKISMWGHKFEHYMTGGKVKQQIFYRALTTYYPLYFELL